MKNLTKLNQDGKLSKKVKFMIEKESLKSTIQISSIF